MWWIIGIVMFIILVFLWMIVRSAARSVDEKTQAMYDEEQSKYIENYFREKQDPSKEPDRRGERDDGGKKENG